MRKKVRYYTPPDISDLKDMLLKCREKYGGKAALKYKRNKKWHAISYNELFYKVMSLGCFLESIGLTRGTKVAIMSENRPEWALTYLSVACGNGINVPIDKELKSQEMFHILYTTEANIFVGSQKYIEMLTEFRSKLPNLKTIISMDTKNGDQDVLTFDNVLEIGSRLFEENKSKYPHISIDPDFPVSIIFTSGTTGSSKGVVLTQKNLVEDVKGITEMTKIETYYTFLSVLPLHHTYECTGGFLMPIACGCTIAYAESLKKIPDNLKEVKPDAMLAVPLLLEAVYKKVMKKIEENGPKKFKIAKGIAAFTETFFRKNIRRKIFKPLHEGFGGNLKYLVSGGAAIDPEVSKGFRDMGIVVLQGYGLTETSPVIALNKDDFYKYDSAGLPLPEAQIKIVDGEICVKGPMVMKGYYNNPEATAEVLKDGWFYTGDMGYFDKDGFLYINGRKKSLIVAANGKNIYPEEIEAHLNKSPFILESIVWEGPEATKYCEEVHAIIVPDVEYFDEFLSKQGKQMDEKVVEEILDHEVKKVCSSLANYKRVKKFTIHWNEFEKTTTKKIKRYLYTSKIRSISDKKSK